LFRIGLGHSDILPTCPTGQASSDVTRSCGRPKIPAVAKVIYKVGKGVNAFLDSLERARSTLERLRKLLDTLKAGQTVAACLAPIADVVQGAAAKSSTRLSPAAVQAGAKPKFCVTSALGKGTRLAKLAEKSTQNQAVQKEMNVLINKLIAGNDNPGRGTKGLPGGIRYLRGDAGARLFFRQVGDGWEIVGKADKALESNVIAELGKLYG
ncbi:hypothetical protein ACFY0O_27270, partial [Streptomyces sp. NPDC001594]